MKFVEATLPIPDRALKLANDADLAAVAGRLPEAPIVVLDFPRWTDGRAYSQARLLRSRLRFAGELWADGDVVVDMLPLLQRSGFDAVRLRADQDPALARRALGFFSGHYQADLVSKLPRFAQSGASPR